MPKWTLNSEIELDENQLSAVEELKSGSILKGGVGSGKTRTALYYYFFKVCGGFDQSSEKIKLINPTNLYVITTAKKRDSFEWDREAINFYLVFNGEPNMLGITCYIDSWNNISKYKDVKDSFFIFDEQRIVGSGEWSKAFLKIAKNNKWILLSATPGDTWIDYLPVFLANGFYKNRSEFFAKHVIFSPFVNYPKIERYINCQELIRNKRKILVEMEYNKRTIRHYVDVEVQYDRVKFETIRKTRWDVYDDCPIDTPSKYFFCLRRATNSHIDRIYKLVGLLEKHSKILVFYNFNYEIDAIKKDLEQINVCYGEYNGFTHDPIPNTQNWVYLVQYAAGCEGWNCTETDAICFFSLSYSYKMMEQAAGRIDRRSSPYEDLYYYRFVSESKIDKAIVEALNNKKNFNEKEYLKKELI